MLYSVGHTDQLIVTFHCEKVVGLLETTFNTWVGAGKGKEAFRGRDGGSTEGKDMQSQRSRGHNKEGCLACTVMQGGHVRPFQKLIWTLDCKAHVVLCSTCWKTDKMVPGDRTLSEVLLYGVLTLERIRNRSLKKTKGWRFICDDREWGKDSCL